MVLREGSGRYGAQWETGGVGERWSEGPVGPGVRSRIEVSVL